MRPVALDKGLWLSTNGPTAISAAARGPLCEVYPVGRATHQNLRHGLFAARLWACGGTNRFQKRKIKVAASNSIPNRSRGRATSPTLRGERSRRAGGKNWARRRDRIDAVPGRTNESGSRPKARASVMGNVSLWSMFQALRRGPVQYTDCFSWRERGKLCGVARPNEEEMRRDRPRARPFRGQ